MENDPLLASVVIVFCLTIFAGWVANIAKLLELGFSESDLREVNLRMVGILIFPLGAVMGFL
mgnify:CR=1 FL=1